MRAKALLGIALLWAALPLPCVDATEVPIELADGFSVPVLAVKSYDQLQIWIDNSIGNNPIVIVAVVDSPFLVDFAELAFFEYLPESRSALAYSYDSSEKAIAELKLLDIFSDKQDYYEAERQEHWPLRGFSDLVKPDNELRDPIWLAGTSYSLISLKRDYFSQASWEKLSSGDSCILVEFVDDIGGSVLPICQEVSISFECSEN